MYGLWNDESDGAGRGWMLSYHQAWSSEPDLLQPEGKGIRSSSPLLRRSAAAADGRRGAVGLLNKGTQAKQMPPVEAEQGEKKGFMLLFHSSPWGYPYLTVQWQTCSYCDAGRRRQKQRSPSNDAYYFVFFLCHCRLDDPSRIFILFYFILLLLVVGTYLIFLQ